MNGCRGLVVFTEFYLKTKQNQTNTNKNKTERTPVGTLLTFLGRVTTNGSSRKFKLEK